MGGALIGNALEQTKRCHEERGEANRVEYCRPFRVGFVGWIVNR